MDTNEMIVKARGRITNLWKSQVRTDCLIQGVKQANQYKIEKNSKIRGSNGTYLEIGDYLGTALYINVTVYAPPVFEVNGEKYQIPERFRIDCYDTVRKSIGHKAFGKLAIFDRDIEDLRDSMVGEKVTISFHSQAELITNDYLKVFVILPFAIGKEYPFYGIINARKV